MRGSARAAEAWADLQAALMRAEPGCRDDARLTTDGRTDVKTADL